jgi:hypothetical protein
MVLKGVNTYINYINITKIVQGCEKLLLVNHQAIIQ